MKFKPRPHRYIMLKYLKVDLNKYALWLNIAIVYCILPISIMFMVPIIRLHGFHVQNNSLMRSFFLFYYEKRLSQILAHKNIFKIPWKRSMSLYLLLEL